VNVHWRDRFALPIFVDFMRLTRIFWTDSATLICVERMRKSLSSANLKRAAESQNSLNANLKRVTKSPEFLNASLKRAAESWDFLYANSKRAAEGQNFLNANLKRVAKWQSQLEVLLSVPKTNSFHVFLDSNLRPYFQLCVISTCTPQHLTPGTNFAGPTHRKVPYVSSKYLSLRNKSKLVGPGSATTLKRRRDVCHVSSQRAL